MIPNTEKTFSQKSHYREIAGYTSARGSCIYLWNAIEILQNLFRNQRLKSIDFIDMEPDSIETYFGLKLVIIV